MKALLSIFKVVNKVLSSQYLEEAFIFIIKDASKNNHEGDIFMIDDFKFDYDEKKHILHLINGAKITLFHKNKKKRDDSKKRCDLKTLEYDIKKVSITYDNIGESGKKDFKATGKLSNNIENSIFVLSVPSGMKVDIIKHLIDNSPFYHSKTFWIIILLVFSGLIYQFW